ncbi:MAG TPA: tRNA-guanine transglycosylase, partial [Candidatus Paceibacterota bacterium]
MGYCIKYMYNPQYLCMFRVIAKDKKSKARAGELETHHGVVRTPAYVIVGTHAKVRAVTSDDLKSAHTQIVIANTFHLWRTLGEEGLKTYGGLHGAMGWDGPIMTDSGGFQVFSFGASREEGVGKVAHVLSDKYALD